jgi:tetratricopeptide (TPR) repeat protein
MLPRSFIYLAIGLIPWCWTGSVSAARYAPADPPIREAAPGETRASDAGSLEARLWSDVADQRLDEFSLVEAVLIAGGVSDRQALRHHNRQLAAWLEELETCSAGRSREDRAQAVLEFMHRRILAAGFQQDGTDLSAALDNGRFNCVSSTVLFLALARGCGLEVEAVAEPAHVFCRLLLERGSRDVQTTDPRAFDTARAESARQPAESIPSSPARPLSETGILALVYYNAGVARLARSEFSQALEANERALRLDPGHREARANLLATYNNWALECVRQGKHRQAIELLNRARAHAKGQPQLTANLRAIYQGWAAEHVQAGRYKEALAVLDEGLESLPSDGALLDARHAVERRWLRSRMSASPPHSKKFRR